MRVVLVGAPGSGKSELRAELEKRDDVLIRIDGHMSIEKSFTFGELADYRTELYLATGRAHVVDVEGKINVYSHSLIDSMAYASARIAGMQRYQSVTEDEIQRWWLTLYIIATMQADTFKADHVLLLPGHIEEDGVFYSALEEGLEHALELTETLYTKLDPNGSSLIDQAAKILV